MSNPWQRQPPSINRDSTAWGLYRAGTLLAYVIARVTPRLIFADTACAPGESDGLRTLIGHFHRLAAAGVFVNLAENDPVWPLFAELGYTERMSQYEMCLSLR